MKRVIPLLALLLVFVASTASAAGNATIAVQGRDGFDDYISAMYITDGNLALTSI